MYRNPDRRLEGFKDEIISSIVEYIQEQPSLVKRLNGKVEKIADDDITKYKKREAVGILKNANDYELLYESYGLPPRALLKLNFNNNYYAEYFYMLNSWNKQTVECGIYNRINKAFNTAIKYYVGETTTTVKGIFIPENKNLHKKHPTQQHIIDNVNDVALLYNSQPFKHACENLSKSLKDESYSDVITNARSLIESYCKTFLNKDEISNKTALVDIFKKIEIVPEGVDKNIEKEVQQIIESLNKAIESLSNIRNDKSLISQAHGGGPNAVHLEESHAYLAAGAVMCVINFISKAKKKST